MGEYDTTTSGPSNLLITNVTGSVISLAWNATVLFEEDLLLFPDAKIGGYEIRYRLSADSKDSNPWSVWSQTGVVGLTAIVAGLVADTPYDFEVQAIVVQDNGTEFDPIVRSLS